MFLLDHLDGSQVPASIPMALYPMTMTFRAVRLDNHTLMFCNALGSGVEMDLAEAVEILVVVVGLFKVRIFLTF